jgi:hypothetical protein
MKQRKATAALLAAVFALSGASAAFANPSPPTNGGNGAGKSGQCTGPPSERPPVCPAT